MRQGALLLLGFSLTLCSCDPFASMTTKIDERVPDGEAGEIQLLSSEHRLPDSASNVRLYFLHFQDSILRIRFEAPRTQAVEFAEAYVGMPLQDGCGGFRFERANPDWWIADCPPGAVHAEQMFSDDPPARYVLMVADADRATVWIDSFGD